MTTLIKSIEDLQTRAQKEDGCECFIVLGGGLVKSSKQIWYHKDSELWDIYNDIDGSDLEDLSLMELTKNTNIIKALKAGALFQY